MSGDVTGLVSQLTLTPKKEKVEENERKTTDGKNGIYNTFPWLEGFLKLCREAVGSRNIKILESLLSTFVKQVAVSIKDCYSKPKRAAKLRTVVNETLVYFNMFYQDLKFEVENFDVKFDVDNLIYLDLMTDLMAMYLDLEIKASKRGIDSLKKIGQIMTSSLYVFLDQSEDHIIEAILKAKLIIKSNGELCAPVLSKFLKEGKCFVAHENAYVRYLLAFKLWKKISCKLNTRKSIIRMAVKKLDPPLQLIDSIKNMTNILPQMPISISDQDMTRYFMNKKFNFIKAKLEFLRTRSLRSTNFPRSLPDKPFAFMDCSTDSKGRRSRNSFLIDDVWSSLSPSGTGIIGLSTDKQKPRVPLITNSGTELSTNDECFDDIEFIEAPKKDDKLVDIITIDSDEETSQKESRILSQEKHEENVTLPCSKSFKKDPSKKSCLKKKKKKKSINKNEKKVPDTKKIISEVCSSTKPNGRVTPRLESPERGIVDSTSSNMGSPKYQVYEIHSNTSWDEKTEVASSSESNEACGSSVQHSSVDFPKMKNGEISSTRLSSVPFSNSVSVDSIDNLSNNSELPNYRCVNSRPVPESDNTISNSSLVDSSSRVSKSLTFEEKADAESNMSEKENLTYQSRSDKVISSLDNKLNSSAKTTELNLHSNGSIVKQESSKSGLGNSVIQNWLKMKKSIPGLGMMDTEKKTSAENVKTNQQGEALFPGKNSVHEGKSAEKLNQILSDKFLINSKKVELEKSSLKVGSKSFKIVKSNILKNNTTPSSGRSLLKSTYPSGDGETKKPGDVPLGNRTINQFNFLSKHVKISGAEINGLKNSRKSESSVTNRQYYNNNNNKKGQNEIVDDFTVPEVAQEEFVCATTEIEPDDHRISSSETKNQEITEQKIPHRTGKQVPIIFKTISDETAHKKNNKKSEPSSIADLLPKSDRLSSKQRNAQKKIPLLVNQTKAKTPIRLDQSSPSPPTLTPEYPIQPDGKRYLNGEESQSSIQNNLHYNFDLTPFNQKDVYCSLNDHCNSYAPYYSVPQPDQMVSSSNLDNCERIPMTRDPIVPQNNYQRGLNPEVQKEAVHYPQRTDISDKTLFSDQPDILFNDEYKIPAHTAPPYDLSDMNLRRNVDNNIKRVSDILMVEMLKGDEKESFLDIEDPSKLGETPADFDYLLGSDKDCFFLPELEESPDWSLADFNGEGIGFEDTNYLLSQTISKLCEGYHSFDDKFPDDHVEVPDDEKKSQPDKGPLDENGKLHYFRYPKNYPDLITIPCQRNSSCVCVRCTHKRKYIRHVLLTRRDFFLQQLKAAKLKRYLHEADRLKSQDDELLRRIEESFKPKKPEFKESSESKEKIDVIAKLPLKKRLKKLVEGASESSSTDIQSTPVEKFPSYPIKPMISIAELAIPNLEKQLSYIPPKVLEPVKSNDKIDTVLPVKRPAETEIVQNEEINNKKFKVDENDKIKKLEPINGSVKNLPAFEKMVEMHRSAYLAQVKGEKPSSSSVDMMKSFMNPMSVIQPEKGKSQIAQRYDYKVAKPLQKNSTNGGRRSSERKEESPSRGKKSSKPKHDKHKSSKSESSNKNYYRKSETKSSKKERKSKCR